MTFDAFLYFILLALWSALVAYYVLFVARGRQEHVKDAHAHAAPKGHGHAPHHAPAHHSSAKVVVPRGRFSPHEGFKSFARDVEVTVEDIVKGLSRDD